jgi:hypothetical protein
MIRFMTLLDSMNEFVRQEPLPIRHLRGILPFSKNYIPAASIRPCIYLPSRRCRWSISMYAYLAKVLAKPRLEKLPRGGSQRLPAAADRSDI